MIINRSTEWRVKNKVMGYYLRNYRHSSCYATAAAAAAVVVVVVVVVVVIALSIIGIPPVNLLIRSSG